jgi:hypothetical protein
MTWLGIAWLLGLTIFLHIADAAPELPWHD